MRGVLAKEPAKALRLHQCGCQCGPRDGGEHGRSLWKTYVSLSSRGRVELGVAASALGTETPWRMDTYGAGRAARMHTWAWGRVEVLRGGQLGCVGGEVEAREGLGAPGTPHTLAWLEVTTLWLLDSCDPRHEGALSTRVLQGKERPWREGMPTPAPSCPLHLLWQTEF